MKPLRKLAETRTPDGAILSLHSHDRQFKILHEGRELMHSFTTASEEAMATHVATACAGRAAPRHLIGGLGLGFTLRALLVELPPDGLIEVVELLPAVVEWNRTHLRELNGALLDHPQVRVHEGDVAPFLQAATEASYDGILLDVDNGPTAMVQGDNATLYQKRGLASVRRVLRPGGIVAYWSASPDRPFERRLQQAGFASFEAIPTKAYPGAKRAAYVIYYARKGKA